MFASRDRGSAVWAGLGLGVCAALAALACSPEAERKTAAAYRHCMPAALDGPDTAVRIDRRAESARALELIAQVQG